MGLIPKDTQFFESLEQQAATVLDGAKKLLHCLENYTNIEAAYLASKEIHEVEQIGDEQVHQLMDRLNKSFITPLDREDIYALTVRLDDILDYVDAVGKRLVTFAIEKPTPYAIELSRIIVRSAEEVHAGVGMLRNLKKPEALLRQCAKINQLENDGDQVFRDALTSLFKDHKHDPVEIIKWKDIYEQLEIATDKCEDVANVLQTVIVKYT